MSIYHIRRHHPSKLIQTDADRKRDIEENAVIRKEADAAHLIVWSMLVPAQVLNSIFSPYTANHASKRYLVCDKKQKPSDFVLNMEFIKPCHLTKHSFPCLSEIEEATVLKV